MLRIEEAPEWPGGPHERWGKHHGVERTQGPSHVRFPLVPHGLPVVEQRCGQASSKKKLRMARDAATKVVVMMRRHTAPAHAKGGEGLNLCICMVLRTLERMLGMGGEGLNPLQWHQAHT